MNSTQFLTDFFKQCQESAFDPEVIEKLGKLRDDLVMTQASGKKTIIAGNGGSAAIAAHCSIDLSKNAGIRCVNFSDSSLITCLANDYGYDRWLAKALELYGDKGDLIILISSSGRSANMVAAADYALGRGNRLVTLTGFDRGNPLNSKGELKFWVDSRAYNVVEISHQVWLLAVCDLIIGRMEYPSS